MIVNVTMLTHGRTRLTEQALQTLAANTDLASYTFTAFDDDAKLGTGAARNRVIEMAMVAPRDLLYLSDNDVAFLPGWLSILTEAYEVGHDLFGVTAIGAYLHPFNQPYQRIGYWSDELGDIAEIGLVHALSTQSWLWSWKDALRFGPFVETPVGKVGCSEDVEMSQRIVAAGGKLAVIIPNRVVNTSLTNTFGQDVVGRDLLEKEPSYGACRK